MGLFLLNLYSTWYTLRGAYNHGHHWQIIALVIFCGTLEVLGRFKNYRKDREMTAKYERMTAKLKAQHERVSPR